MEQDNTEKQDKKLMRIHSDILGKVDNIVSFLSQFEKTYNNLVIFDKITQLAISEKKELDRHYKYRERYLINLREFLKYSKSSSVEYFRKSEDYRNSFERLLFDSDLLYAPIKRIDLLSRQFRDSLILNEDKLILNKVNFQSPGFWEFLGSVNPLQQIREYIKDRHERNKDRKWRDNQEEKKVNLENQLLENKIIHERINILKSLNYSNEEIKIFINETFTQPLAELNKFQDNNTIGKIK